MLVIDVGQEMCHQYHCNIFVLEYNVKPVPDLSSQVDLESYLNDELTDSYTCKCKNKEVLNIEFSPVDEFSKDRFQIFQLSFYKISETKFSNIISK